MPSAADLADDPLTVDDTPMLVAAPEADAAPYAEPVAADAALGVWDVGPLDNAVPYELAVYLSWCWSNSSRQVYRARRLSHFLAIDRRRRWSFAVASLKISSLF